MSAAKEILPGLWRWTAQHPEWRPHREFGGEVASFALELDDSLVLVDPLIPGTQQQDREQVLDVVDRLAAGRPSVAVMITIPYHVRSAELLHDRYGADTVSVWGHPAVARRLGERVKLAEVAPGAELFGRISAHPIGRPRRYEMPLLVPSHRALAFGDAVVGVEGGLRVWQDVQAGRSELWYRERFLPSLEPLLELDFDRVLVTHGEPVLEDGPVELRRALSSDPCDYGH